MPHPPRLAERQQFMRRLLMRLALEVDPEGGRLYVLCKELDVAHGTLSTWIKKGEVTPVRARDINRRFGDKLAPVKMLVGSR